MTFKDLEDEQIFEIKCCIVFFSACFSSRFVSVSYFSVLSWLGLGFKHKSLFPYTKCTIGVKRIQICKAVLSRRLCIYSTIIPRARMSSASIAHSAFVLIGYCDSEAIRARGIVLVKPNQWVKNIETKQVQLFKAILKAIVLVFKAGAFATSGL